MDSYEVMAYRGIEDGKDRFVMDKAVLAIFEVGG